MELPKQISLNEMESSFSNLNLSTYVVLLTNKYLYYSVTVIKDA